MTRLVCRIGLTNDVDDPVGLFDGMFEFIRDFYRRETAYMLEIEPDISTLQQPFPVLQSGEVDAFSLHTMLRRLTGNALDVRPVDTIALIIARSYRGNETAFGMMFDEGYVFSGDPADDVVEPEVLGPPREGCAIFIDAIADKRGPRGTADFKRELRFTALHELGHVFNLQHQDSLPNIMKRSAVYGLQPPKALCLSSADRARLSQDPLAFENYPGGANFGYGASANAPSGWRFNEQKVNLGLQIKIQVSHSEAFAFEPIELDIEISLPPGKQRTMRIPRTVDPGYDSFRIWIEEPSGARRMLRSPRRYCGTLGWLTITQNRPFQRDVSIGRQAGGPVFRRAGVHHVWAEMNLGHRGMLRSNRVPVRIRDLTEMSQADAAAYNILRNPFGVVLGYSRVLHGSQSLEDKVVGLVQAFPYQSWSSLLRYSIVRAAAANTQKRDGLAELPAPIHALAALASEDNALGEHRAAKVRQILRTSSKRIMDPIKPQ